MILRYLIVSTLTVGVLSIKLDMERTRVRLRYEQAKPNI